MVFTNYDIFESESKKTNPDYRKVETLLDPRTNPANRWNATSPNAAIKNNASQTFYLAKQPANVANTYTVAVVAKNHPDTLSAVQLPNSPTPITTPIPAPAQIRTLGYGVAAYHPSDSESVCPNDSRHPAYGSIMKPTNMKWAKLWQFRSNFEKRTKLVGTGSDSFATVGNKIPILCNPGAWSDDGQAVFPDCSTHFIAKPPAIPDPSEGMCSISPNYIPEKGNGVTMTIRFNCPTGAKPSDLQDKTKWVVILKTSKQPVYSKSTIEITKITTSSSACGCSIQFKLPKDAHANFDGDDDKFVEGDYGTFKIKFLTNIVASQDFSDPTPTKASTALYREVYNSSTFNFTKLDVHTYAAVNGSPTPTISPTPILTGLHAALDQQTDDLCNNGSNLVDRVIAQGPKANVCLGYQSLPNKYSSNSGVFPDQLTYELGTVDLSINIPGFTPAACMKKDVQFYPGTFPYHLFDYHKSPHAWIGDSVPYSCTLDENNQPKLEGYGIGRAGYLRFSNNAADKKGRGTDLFGSVTNFGEGNGTDHYFRVGEYVQASQITIGKSLISQADPFPAPGMALATGLTPIPTPTGAPQDTANFDKYKSLLTPAPTRAPNLLTRHHTGLVTDTSIDLTEIDPFNFVDYLFVATPTDLEVEDFTDPTSKGRQYIPWRVDSKESCLMGINPSKLDITDKDSYLKLIHEGVERGTCNLMSYSPFLVPADDNPDSTNDDPSRQRFFPICVLQEGP